MIISPGGGWIFVHIPKTGGTSMMRALEPALRPDDLLIGDTAVARARRGALRGLRPAGRLWKHARLADIEGIVRREEFDRFLVFTLVRNPWDRMVSYYHWLRAQTFRHPAVARARALGFAAFLADPATQAEVAGHPYPWYVTDGAGQERAARFLRLEALEEDIDPVAARLGLRPVLPHVNRSARPADWRSLYDDQSAAIVARIAAADIARFGYRFEPPA